MPGPNFDLVFPESGHYLPASKQMGELTLKSDLTNTGPFTYEAPDLKSRELISPATAVLGGKITVQTLDGPEHLELDPVVQPGHEVLLKNRSVQKYGDHRIKLRIDTPTRLTPKMKAVLQKIKDL